MRPARRPASPGPTPRTPAPAARTQAPTRRKRRRQPWPWRAILGTLLVGNVIAGVLWSPALTIRRATIEGAESGDAPLAEAAISALRGRSSVRLDTLGIESASLADARYVGADFRRSLLGSARLRLTRRIPVAVVVDRPPHLIDASGTVYDDPAQDWKGLPRVIVPPDLRVTAAALGAPCDLRRLAGIAVALRPIVGERAVGIEVRSGGVICLNMESARVRLGTGDRLEAKLSTLRRILDQKPGILREIKELNLMAPDRPKTVPRAATPSTPVSQNPAPDPANTSPGASPR